MHAYRLAESALDNPDLAVVGMAARLPGAPNTRKFWKNLAGGVESVSRLSKEELIAAGEDPLALHDPNYVPAAATLDRLEEFDAAFFGFSNREASVLDPQHRHFLEVCFEALEDAGVVPSSFPGAIGVFAGSGMNAYLPYNLFTNPELMRSMGLFLVRHTGNDKDFLTTRVSYCLNLKGPSVNVQTACSTSLVAIHLAAQSLLAGECDVALAGGVTIELPHRRGYHYQAGEILSPDGHCRPFDARSQGTVFGSGAGVVVLKRLRDAVESGDTIHALVKGSAVNNDGNRKVGYLAPSVEGQAECVVEALQVSGLTARDITYIECHGTGTPVGDPIEVAALTQAFARSTTDKGFCGVGSVKSNIGHLDTAAGVASFIKVVQMLESEQIAPTLHYEAPNPQIDFGSTPFFVVGATRRWPRTDAPRRAGVSSLGVGGTNAHVIVEEAPRRVPPEVLTKPAIFLLSARSRASLEIASQELGVHLGEHPELGLGEVSSTLLHGRERFQFRRVFAATELGEARALLASPNEARVFDVDGSGATGVPLVFLFPGGGAQHANMARGLYRTEPRFREVVDECLTMLREREGLELGPTLFPPEGSEAAATRALEQPSLALPALLTIEVALAELLRSLGFTPAAMIGHSLGEYAAAHLAGVLSLEAALGIVCCRGRLFERVSKGGMLSVPLAPEALEPFVAQGLSIAAINAPDLCVLSGDLASLDRAEQELKARDIEARRLHIDVPAHSPLLDGILPEFKAYLAGVRLGAPSLPYASNVTGEPISAEELANDYFARHLRSTVRFSDGISRLLERHPNAVLVEVGPGHTLSSLSRLQPARRPTHAVVPLLPHVKDTTDDSVYFRSSLGRLLAHGASGDLDAIAGTPRRIVPLPATPFEHKRHWVEPGSAYFMARADASGPERESDVARWFFTKTFREDSSPRGEPAPAERWLVFAEGPLARSLPFELGARGIECVLVTPGDETTKISPAHYCIDLSSPDAYDDLLQRVVTEGGMPSRFLHALCLTPELLDPEATPSDAALDRVFFSLLYLAQVLGQEELSKTTLVVGTARACDVAGTGTLRPLHALAEGPVRVIPKEIPEISARICDLVDADNADSAAQALVDEALRDSSESLVALRGRTRYVERLERASLEDDTPLALPDRPVMLFTGGLGGIARSLAAHFVTTRGARIALISRSGVPGGEERNQLRSQLDEHDPRVEQLEWLTDLESRGADVLVEKADVTSADELRAAVERVRQRFGRIDAVVHAAGVLDDAPLALKDRAGVRRVLDPKAFGARNVIDALASDPPALVLLLSSTSAALGPPGQVDYVAANAYVNALARRVRHASPRSRVLALGYGVWRDTGMAARAVGPFAPRIEGKPTGHPLLERVRPGTDVTEFESLYDASELWALDEHRVRGASAVLPGTATLEAIRAAGAWTLSDGSAQKLEVRDVLFLSPLEVPDGQRRLVRVTVRREDGTSPSVTVGVTSRGRDDRNDVEHATGSVATFSDDPPEKLPIGDLEARSSARLLRFDEGKQLLPQDQFLTFGPRWRVIREMRFGNAEGIARLTLPARFAGDCAEFELHPGMLDMLTGFAFSLADPTSTSDRLRVPLSYQRVRIHAPLEREIVSYVRMRQSSDDGVAVFDAWAARPDGTVLVEIKGYTTKSVAPASLAPLARAPKEPSLLERWAELGITREEGAEVVERLLLHEPPADLYASPISLHTLLEQIRPARETSARSAGTATPQAEEVSQADAPRDDVERRLAEMWCSLLGLERVGIRDNFFELGGHSLIAVRLFARIKKAYGVDLPLAMLFQAPTIEKSAEMLRGALGIELRVEAKSRPLGSSPLNAPAQTALAHVVSIQEGNGRVPMFCVHGAGGNVLNFRLLARHLGPDQPFFGVQARGVTGETPHHTVEEMADDYLREIRSVWPQGPYLLGGYSGGGVVAYEMAQRLVAAGEKVPLVVFLDTFHPSTSPRKLSLGERMERLLAEGPRYLSRQGKAKISRHFGELSSELKLLYYTSNGLPLPHEFRELRLFRAFREAAARYRPEPYRGRVLLLRARLIDEIYRHMGPTLGWRELVPNLEIIEVPGGHDSLVLEPNVQVLTSHLARVIAEST